MNGQCRIRKLMEKKLMKEKKIDPPWTNGGACMFNRPSQRRNA